MERLIEDANRVKAANGEMADLSINSFADIVDAIHIVQDEMGIAGATAAEAEGTISGSAAAMKGAWTNLVSGLANGNADVNALLDEFLSSVQTLGKNVLPVVKTILTNIGKTFEENGPEMTAQGALMLAKLALGIIEAIPGLIAKIPQVVKAVVKEFKERGPEFKQIGKDLLEGIWNGISDKIAWLKGKVRGVVDTIKGWFTGSDGFDTHSPSKWSEKVFRNVMEGSGKGLESGMPAMMRTTKSVTDRIKSGLSFEAGEITTARTNPVRNAFGQIRDAVFGEVVPINITVQSVLDGDVIAEKVTRVQARMRRAGGLA